MATTKPHKTTAAPTPAPPASTPSPAPGTAGLPGWLIFLGALVPALALLWSVVSHFVPKVESASAPAATASAPAPSVSVSGSGNVGVGVMTGGTINNTSSSGKP